MITKTTPTPTPWALQEDGLGGYYVNARIEAGDEDYHDPRHDSVIFRCDQPFSGVPPDGQEADADLIVRAVNSHAALVEACEAALTKLEAMKERFGAKWPVDLSPGQAVETKLKAALALARGKEGDR